MNYQVEFKSDPVLMDFDYSDDNFSYNYEVTFTIADNSWEIFDNIYYTYKVRNVQQDIALPYGTYNAILGIFSSDYSALSTNNIDVIIYGIKNGKKSLVNTKTVYTVSDVVGKYDKTPPSVTILYPEMYECTLKIIDYGTGESGLDKIVLYKNDGTQMVLLEVGDEYYDWYYETKPMSFFEEYGNEAGFVIIEATDKNGNSTIFNVYYKKKLTTDRIYGMKKDSSSKWTMIRIGGNFGRSDERWYYRLDTNESGELYWKDISSPTWTAARFISRLAMPKAMPRSAFTTQPASASGAGIYGAPTHPRT